MSQLFYVIGASGVGKDSLLNYAREKINGSRHVLFAHRYITRDAFSGNENHVSLSKLEFEHRKALGLFAMDWESHNQYYGIGIEINLWMQKGGTVVLNGSREYLPVAQEKFSNLTAILITAEPATIYQRLLDRKRESVEDIQKRIERNLMLSKSIKNCVVLENNGSLELAGNQLIQMLSS